tara:strand:- start:1805 stop:2317 length:513 start_codon:yes stop_codon:yes gene_type:complete
MEHDYLSTRVNGLGKLKPLGVFPEEGVGEGFVATACDALNSLVSDGGNSGAISWWRLPISILEHPELCQGWASAWKSSDYIQLKQPKLAKTVFEGEIDVSEFYWQAIAAKAFTGQRGFWVDRWARFDGGVPDFQNPDERHGIDWAFFIFESHGHLKVVTEVSQLGVVLVS